MALLHIDSFDAGSQPMKWSTLYGTTGAGCRAGGLALVAGPCGGTLWLDPTVADWGIAVRIFWNGQPQTGILFGFVGGYVSPHRDWDLCIDALGRIYIRDYTLEAPGPTWQATATLFTCTRGMVANAWNYVQVKQEDGTGTIKVNGDTVGSGTLAGAAQCGVGFYGDVATGLKFDDWMLISIDEETPDLPVDQAIEAYTMASDDSVEWTPKTGSDNYAMVDDNPSDEEATYNSTDAVNKTDLFKLDPTGIDDLDLEVFGVQLTVRAEKVNTASMDLVPVVVSGTTESLGPRWGLAVGYGTFRHPLALNPDTGAAWTVAEILAASYGYRSLAPGG